MWLIKIMENFQQTLVRRIWNPPKKEVEVHMIIKGKIISVVRLNDIGKSLEYGKELSLNAYEVNKSKDLQNAISRNWVEVVFDRGMLKRAMVTQCQQEQKIADVDIIEIAKKMAQSMAEEMIKNSPLVKEIAKEIAKEMVIGINESIKTQQVVVQQQLVDKKSSENIFVDFKDEEVGMKASINDIGTVEVQKDDLSSSLEKMKKFRQSKTKE
jgi:hypothetical protein